SFTINESLFNIRLLRIGGYVKEAEDDLNIIELKPGHHIGLEYNEEGKVDKIIVNNKEKHPHAHLVEVEAVDLDHDLYIDAYHIGDEENVQRFSVDLKAFINMDEIETQITHNNQ